LKESKRRAVSERSVMSQTMGRMGLIFRDT